MDALLQDFRYAVRTLTRSRGFTTLAALTLALGIGANTALFSVVNALLLRPLPYQDPDRIVAIWNRWTEWPKVWLSDAEYFNYRAETGVFERVAVFERQAFNLTGGDVPERVFGGAVSRDLFAVLGVAPSLGRSFGEDEDRPGGTPVVVLGDGVWRRRFSADPAVIGRDVELDGVPHQVIGVMPPGFGLPTDFADVNRTEFWVPLRLDPAATARGSHYLVGVARLPHGLSLDQAQARLDLVTRNLVARYPDNYQSDFGATVTPIREEILGHARRVLVLLFGAVGFVLLTACANVANLLLVRGEARQREMAVRSALGARRLHLVRQLLIESTLLSLVGAAGGVLLAAWLTDALVSIDPAFLPRVSDITIDGHVLAFTAVMSTVTGLVFGLVPALHASGGDMQEALKSGGRDTSVGPRASRARQTLVVSEVALALILVIGAGLMIRSFWRLQAVPAGFEPTGVLTMGLSLPEAEYPDGASVASFFRQLREQIERIPGVTAAGSVSNLPLSTTLGDWDILLEGQVADPRRRSDAADWQVVTPGYFEALRIPLRRGRFFADSDLAEAPPAVIVNETMARAYWPDQDPIGRRFRLGDGPLRSIVGVVADVRHRALDEGPRREMFLPLDQFLLDGETPMRSLTVVIRTAGDPGAVTAAARSHVRRLDPALPISDVRTMDQVVADSVSDRKLTLVLLSVFAGLAMALAGIGIYAVMAFTVSRRSHEIGVRMALGASRAAVMRLVIGQGMRLALAGLAVGLVGAALLTRLMASLLFGVGPTDPVTFAVISLFIVVVALAATSLPARRATQVDPLTALRIE